ncbi:hypothetical protein [Conexibacter sp. CPCC 206217]|uniref:hypothetical protein n=1 Tax=Conexibacter sp. CPCC 206217 TaxID=3064574 RepID=UPI0027253ACB|nr:hypothetical protein [Conexibacter sp. CPCC 206217]MDO8213976.1 hypothetical protein [Conexibacter sp. CPCC 206217]
MSDPRTTLVLIRAAKSETWEDKTSKIADIVDVTVRFVGSAKPYRYGADRIRVLAERDAVRSSSVNAPPATGREAP